jgi:hypothetical protein
VSDVRLSYAFIPVRPTPGTVIYQKDKGNKDRDATFADPAFADMTYHSKNKLDSYKSQLWNDI